MVVLKELLPMLLEVPEHQLLLGIVTTIFFTLAFFFLLNADKNTTNACGNGKKKKSTKKGMKMGNDEIYTAIVSVIMAIGLLYMLYYVVDAFAKASPALDYLYGAIFIAVVIGIIIGTQTFFSS